MATDEGAQSRFDELLPWYLNGSITDADRLWFEKYLNAHSDAQRALKSEISLRSAIREGTESVASDAGLAQLLQRIGASRPAMTPGFAQRWRKWLVDVRNGKGSLSIGPGFAVAATLLLAQAGIIGALLGRANVEEGAGAFSSSRALSRSPTASVEVYLRVRFLPDSKEGDIRFLLVSSGARIVAGPSQLGNYFVHVPEDRLKLAKQRLESSGIVESVLEVAEIPVEGQ